MLLQVAVEPRQWVVAVRPSEQPGGRQHRDAGAGGGDHPAGRRQFRRLGRRRRASGRSPSGGDDVPGRSAGPCHFAGRRSGADGRVPGRDDEVVRPRSVPRLQRLGRQTSRRQGHRAAAPAPSSGIGRPQAFGDAVSQTQGIGLTATLEPAPVENAG